MTHDKIFEFDEVFILIHEQDYQYFNETRLDYTKDFFGSGKFRLIKT